MRTVIYVREPSTVAIQTKGGEDCVLMYPFSKVVSSLKAVSSLKVGQHHLDRGIYLALSNSELAVSGSTASAVALPNEKDIPTFPQLQQVLDAAGVSMADLRTFVAALVKDIELSDGPAAAATSKITDDPDGI